MMKLKLKRKYFGDTFTEGKIFVNEGFECYTVEDRDRKLEDITNLKIPSSSAIPRGLYRVVISMSNRFKKELIEILDVPRFTGVRIHSGNSSKDSEGCIIVGSSNNRDDDDWVGGSKIAYDKLHAKVKEAIERGEDITIEIV